MECKTDMINIREYWRDNQKWTIQRNWGHRVHKTKKNKSRQKHNMICVGHHYMLTNTNNVNKTSGDKDEPNIVFMQKL
jgi:hypothetical protein